VFLAAAHCVPPSIMRHLLSAAGNPNTKNVSVIESKTRSEP